MEQHMSFKYWNALSKTNFEAMDRAEVPVLFPIASTEQHGPHLPVGTDAMIVQEIIKRSEQRVADLDFVVLPTLWVAKSIEHKGFLGVISFQTETLIAVLHDIAASVAASGFRKLILLNWHGGNSDLLSSIIRDLHQRHNLQVFLIDGLWLFSDEKGAYDDDFQEYDLHAGRYETGIMMAISPESVKKEFLAEDYGKANQHRLKQMFKSLQYLLPEGGPGRIGWETRDLSVDGVIGEVSGFSADQGRQNLLKIEKRVEVILREISGFEFVK
jgi:creatinine amidohydrolase